MSLWDIERTAGDRSQNKTKKETKVNYGDYIYETVRKTGMN